MTEQDIRKIRKEPELSLVHGSFPNLMEKNDGSNVKWEVAEQSGL